MASALFTLDAVHPLTAEGPSIEAAKIVPTPDPWRTALVDYLSDRYRRTPEEAGMFVDEAHAATEVLNVDPLLVLAVMSVAVRSGGAEQVRRAA